MFVTMVHVVQVQILDRVRALNLINTGGDYKLDVKNFGKMSNLHFLVVDGYECVLHGKVNNILEQVRYLGLRNSRILQLRRVPPKFLLSNLVLLDMSGSSELATTWIGSTMEVFFSN